MRRGARVCALEADSRGCRKAAVSGQDAGRGWRSREERGRKRKGTAITSGQN